ncbi:MAG: PAS domain S-box protein [Gammaproteobacteria bacterium]|nr:PAS domain S-box protein [Gammaproteobacteria bacterium]
MDRKTLPEKPASHNAVLHRNSDERHIHALLEQLTTILYCIDPADFSAFFISPALTGLLGFQIAEWKGVPGFLFRQIHPKDRARVKRELRTAAETADNYRLEYRIYSKDRTRLYWFEDHGTVARDADGKATVLYGEARDITERMSKSASADNDDRRVRQCLEVAGVIVVAIGLDKRITMINRRGCEILGYTEVELLGKNWFEVFIPEFEREFAAQIFDKLIAGTLHHAQRHENTIVTRDGERRTIVWDNTPLIDDLGKPTGILASGEDVTEYRRAITELEASEDRLRVLFEYAPDAYYLINDQGRFADGNKAAEDIVGCKRSELLGKTVVESGLLTSDALPRALQLMERGFRQPIGPAEFQLTRKDGGTVPIEVSSYPVNIHGSRFILAIARNISERKDNQQRLLKVYKETIGTISRTIETRDPYTAGHQQRVAQLATAIGQQMDMDRPILEGLHFGALIHDIGKIYVPAELLNRPGRINVAEFELIKTHCEVGFNIVHDVEFPWPVAEMILQHHERMDGSGYPEGIRGDQIILEARILAVADVVEAMSSHRPYRPSLGMQSALDEIERGTGTHYDPVVADACLTLFREKRFSFEDSRPD